MLYHCGALDPATRRTGKYRLFFRSFVAASLPRAYAWELAVFMATPGFLPENFKALFGWRKGPVEREVEKVAVYYRDDPSVARAARENGHSVDFKDGVEWIQCVADHNKWVPGVVPMWSTLALRDLREQGASDAEIAERFGGPVRAVHIAQWRNLDLFEPLTGLPYVV